MKKNIALLQMAVRIKDVEYNYKHIKSMMEKAMINSERPDILVLPETWNTGFSPSSDLKLIADKNGERTREFCSDFAKNNEVNIVAGSVVTIRDNKLYNTTYIFNRQGEMVAEYDKVHTFSLGHEDDYFESGDHLNIFELDGIRCGSMICYDLRFPELARSLLLKGAEIIFVPAEWPTVRAYPWQILNKARAIENQCFIVAVNGCGNLCEEDLTKGKNAGHSLLLNPLGEEILHLPEEKEIIAIADIDLNEVKLVREKMTNINDRKPNVYETL